MAEDGAACRAEIPAMLSQEQRGASVYTPQCRQRYGERRVEGATPPLNAEDIEEFLNEFAWLKETELALQCLFDGEFDVPKAVKLLLAARQEKFKERRDRNKRLSAEDFENAVATHGKKFYLVKQMLGHKVITREVVSTYYMWKRTPEFKEWRRRQTLKKTKKKKKEAELLRQWGDEEDADPETEAFFSYHNSRCELCATGGKLLCCDGCPRAYHFSCVQPPITKLPSKDEDWYCQVCQEAFGGLKPKLMPSDENEYCMVCAPLPGVPRTLIEAITDASSYEEEEEDSGDEEDEDDSSSELTDDVASDQDDNSPRTEDLSPGAGNSGSVTDNESDNASSKIPSSPLGGDNSSSRKSEQKSPAMESLRLLQKQQRVGAKSQSRAAANGMSSHVALNRPVESLPTGVTRTQPVQLERPGSGRKRHRKTLAPRRIPPPRFDN